MSFFRNFPKTTYDYLGNGVNTNVVDLFRFVKPIERFKDELGIYSYYEIQGGERPDVVSQKLYRTPEYYWTIFVINEHLRTGLSAWPMSSDQFEKYLADEYNGTVISCVPEYTYDGDGILQSIENSLSGRFEIGESVVGFLSGATGVVHSKDPTLQQMVIKDVVGVFQENEIIRGNFTEDFVTTYKVYDWQLAPRYYIDGNGKVEHPLRMISGGVLEQNLTLVTNVEYETDLNEQRSKIRVIKEDRIFEFVDAYQELINK